MREAAAKVVSTLQTAGHVALFNGGCVRDMIMGREPADYDVATSARPSDVITLFRRTRKVGAKFGVVLVRIGGHDVEVATFRRDAGYSDGRRPDAVEFTDAREDALRRDFTLNGMFLDPLQGEIVDYVGGQADIAARLIRAIGDPSQRFAEDHLRMLRAIRFAARFDFTVEPRTGDAIRQHARQITTIAAERCREELAMMLAHPSRARAFHDLNEYGLLPHLWPGASRAAHRAAAVESVLKTLPDDASFELALAAILADEDPRHAAKVCDALRCSNESRRTVTWLVRRRDDFVEPAKVSLADLKLRMADPAFGDLLALFRGRLAAAGASTSAHDEIAARAAAISPEDVAPRPWVSGDDLSEWGVPPGPIYKRVLQRVYYAQLNGDVADREEALRLTRDLLDQPEK